MCVHGRGFNISKHICSFRSPSASSLQFTRSKGLELSVLDLLGRSTGTSFPGGNIGDRDVVAASLRPDMGVKTCYRSGEQVVQQVWR